MKWLLIIVIWMITNEKEKKENITKKIFNPIFIVYKNTLAWTFSSKLTWGELERYFNLLILQEKLILDGIESSNLKYLCIIEHKHKCS